MTKRGTMTAAQGQARTRRIYALPSDEAPSRSAAHAYAHAHRVCIYAYAHTQLALQGYLTVSARA